MSYLTSTQARARLAGLLLASTALAAGSLAASAQDSDEHKNGWYFGGELGTTIPEDNTYRTAGNDFIVEDRLKLGVVGGLVAGYDYNKWRLEAGYHYRRNAVNSLIVSPQNGQSVFPPNDSNADGSLTSHTLSGNVFYNFANLDDWRLYAGVGFGLFRGNANNISFSTGQLLNDDGAWHASTQATLQVVKPISDSLELGFGYRYVHAFDNDYSSNIGTAEFGPRNHDIFVRLTMHFGRPAAKPAPKPAPVPVAAPAPAPVAKPAPAPAPVPAAPVVEEPEVIIPGPFLVFFDFDKSSITPAASRILDAAAKAFKENKLVRIDTTGHADRAGSDSYNLGLSQRRAAAVKSALISRGIPAAEIDVLFKGESDPLVSTADGVREPQNRRVEIVLKGEE